ncbi:putative membrane protein YesL [Pullulanibacillus pueri]|uniref:Membrane protein n=1 Tax=Pullulanibacillus pueri TaxID=1437324 RepID=A0A8J2ZV24_9BACL|nr:DUF624 domain-containing protein [Pullulanibacillus pueri]MBM7682085.1 putative membrane protein YesL [Pullulanibacillus pueri]GGH80041.1 membrane protein [Pullulanibacillus pueri]
MLGKFLEGLFHRVYTLLKLNLYFWLLTLMGAFVLGIGPAFLTVAQLFIRYKWEYKEINWKTVMTTYKESMKRGNLFFYCSSLIMLIFVLNLYYSIQLKHMVFLMIDFLLIFAMVITFVTYIYALFIESKYETSIKNIWQLSFMMFFMDFWTLVKFCIVVCGIGWLTYHSPALILFGSFSLLIALLHFFSKKVFEKLEQRLEFVA